MRRLSPVAAPAGFADFDIWTARTSQRVATSTIDIRLADSILRRLEFNLRAPDALHLALVLRLGGSLATFDDKLALNGRALGLEVTPA